MTKEEFANEFGKAMHEEIKTQLVENGSLPSFEFGAGLDGGPFRVFKVKPEDLATVEEWIEQDSDHRGTDPAFFVDKITGVDCFKLVNGEGTCFYFRLSRVLRIDIQFPPISTQKEKDNLRQSLSAGFRWLAGKAAKAGMSQIIFSSRAPELKTFCRRFGFFESKEELVSSLTAPSPVAGQKI